MSFPDFRRGIFPKIVFWIISQRYFSTFFQKHFSDLSSGFQKLLEKCLSTFFTQNLLHFLPKIFYIFSQKILYFFSKKFFPFFSLKISILLLKFFFSVGPFFPLAIFFPKIKFFPRFFFLNFFFKLWSGKNLGSGRC